MLQLDSSAIDANFGFALREKLTEIGYVDVMQSISNTAYPQQVIERLHRTVNSDLSVILQLFCLARHVPENTIPTTWRSVIRTLEKSGIIRRVDDCCTMAPLCFYIVDGLIYIAEYPNPLFSIYFGEDSHALLAHKRLLTPNRARVLDLCSGAGIQGLSYGAQATEIHLVELNPIAGKLAEVNAAINCPNTNVTVHVIDLVEYLETIISEFDLVLCNPPLVPIPDCYLFNQVSHGGWDGIRFLRPILTKLDKLFSLGGQFITVGVSACVDGRPVIEECLCSSLAGFNVTTTLTYLRSLPLSKQGKWLQMIHDSLLNFGLGQNATDIDSLFEAYRDYGVESVIFYTLNVYRPFYYHPNRTSIKIVDFTKIEGLEGAWKLQ